MERVLEGFEIYVLSNDCEKWGMVFKGGHPSRKYSIILKFWLLEHFF